EIALAVAVAHDPEHTEGGGFPGLLLPSWRPRLRAFSRHAKHSATEKAGRPGVTPAPREPALEIDREDAHAAPEGGLGQRRCDRGRRTPPRARLLARQGRRPRRPAPQHR